MNELNASESIVTSNNEKTLQKTSSMNKTPSLLASSELDHAFASNLFASNPSTSNISSNSSNINPFANGAFQRSSAISPPPQQKTETNQAKASANAENGQFNNYDSFRLIAVDLFDNIKKKKSQDASMFKELHTCLNEWTKDTLAKIDNSAQKKFDSYMSIIHQNLFSINENMEHIQKLEQELREISNRVELLYKEIKESVQR